MKKTEGVESLVMIGSITRSNPILGIRQLIQGQKWQIATHEMT